MIKKTLLSLAAVAAVLLLYLLLWPVPIDPAAWTPQEIPEMTGVYEENTLLRAAERIGAGAGIGPEDLALDEAGNIYAGMEGGNIVRFDSTGATHEVIANTGGRPLGMQFDAAGNLIVCDAFKGLLSIDTAGEITTLTTEAGGIPLVFTDDLDIASDGTIYFSDASVKFDQHHYMLDIMEHRPHGRLLAYDPDAKTTRVLRDGLYFANGVALSPDESFVLVGESWAYRVQRLWLTGEKAGTLELFIDNLPGIPDNITCNGENTFWVAFVQGPPIRRNIDPLMPKPFLRKVIQRLPQAMRPAPIHYGLVLGLDLDGQVIHNLQDPTAEKYGDVTSVTEHGDYLYLGSLFEHSMARIVAPSGS